MDGLHRAASGCQTRVDALLFTARNGGDTLSKHTVSIEAKKTLHHLLDPFVRIDLFVDLPT